MEAGPLRRLAVIGMLAVIAMLVMYLFMAEQVTDTDVPRVRKFVTTVLKRSLEPETETTLRVRMLDSGLDAPRHYELTLTPNGEVAADPRAVEKLMRRGAGHVFEEVGKKRGPVTVTCVARLPGGTEERRTFDAKLQAIEEPEAPPAPEE